LVEVVMPVRVGLTSFAAHLNLYQLAAAAVAVVV
jgi:hypothetical protein